MNKKIWISCQCDNYYKIISKLNNLRINILEIKQKEEKLYLKVYSEDYEKIKKYIISVKFYKITETGFSRYINIIKNNFLYFTIILIGIITFLICNNLIISIDVIHENKEIRKLVIEALKERGVKELTFKKNYDELKQVKQDILNTHKEKLDWLEIEEHGMKYIVKVEARKINDIRSENNYCDVFAKKSGLVTNIQITKGISMISKGDYVNEGDLLISGNITKDEKIVNTVCASGEIYAERWYTVNISLPLVNKTNVRTGQKKINFIFESENYKKRILKARYSSYESENVKIFSLFGKTLFLEKEYETEINFKKYSEEEALNKGLELANEKMLLKLSNKDTIKEKKVLKKVINNSTMNIEVFIITNEIINI